MLGKSGIRGMCAVVGVTLLASLCAQDVQFPGSVSGSLRQGVWVSTASGLYQIASGSSVPVLESPAVAEPVVGAADPARGKVWWYGAGRLQALSAGGAVLADTTPESLASVVQQASGSTAFVVNPADGHLWLSAGSSLYEYDPSSELLLNTVPLEGTIRRLAVDAIHAHLWVGLDSQVLCLDPSTKAVTQSIFLERTATLLDMVVDPASGALWVLTNKELCSYDSTGRLLCREAAEGGEAVAPGREGSAWLASGTSLLHLDAACSPTFSVPLPPADQREEALAPAHLLVDPASGAIWVSRGKKLFQYDATGSLLQTLSLPGEALSLFSEDAGTPPLPSSLARFAWFGCSSLMVNGHTQIYALPAPGGAQGFGGNIASNGPITVNGSNTIDGNATPGPGQQVSINGTSGQVAGSTAPAATALTCDDAGVGAWAQYAQASNNNAAIPAGFLDKNGNFTLNGNKSCTLPGGIYSLASFSGNGNTTLTVSGPVILVVSGTISLNSRCTLNAGGDPTGCLFLQTSGSAVSLNGNGSGDFQVYAPLSSLTVNGNVNGTGNLWANTFTGNGSVVWNRIKDTTPPTVLITAPQNGSYTNKPQPAVSIEYQDNPGGTGVNVASRRVTVDGTDITSALTLGPGGATGTVPSRLADGAHTLLAQVADYDGNVGSATAAFTVKTVPPPPVNSSLVTVSSVTNGSTTVSGAAGATQADTTVQITDTASSAQATASAAADGSFSAQVAAQAGNNLTLVAIDLAGNGSSPITVTVPGGSGGGGTIPPDPSTVAPPLDPTVVTDLYTATQFLYAGTPPIQTGVAPGTIDPRRVAVLRGRVETLAGQPLPGVTITVAGHPEFGQTLSRLDGMFDLVVNGGGPLTVNYAMAGYLTAQRQVQTPWRDYRWLPDVILIQPDSQVTAITFGGTTSIQVARGSAQTDANGTRRATLLFQAGTTASLVLPDGSTQPVSVLHIRATECTVGPNGPKAMPGDLPFESGYTYCVDLSADETTPAGAQGVTFSQPVACYLENFLNFPVGNAVPSGYYDPQRSAWIPSANGLVVRILSITNGMADLDVDGSGTPATETTLQALGITDAERQQVATLYQVGQSLWRVAVSHFSWWDWNWGGGPPPDAVAPDQQAPTAEDGGVNNDCQSPGSIIQVRNQILEEMLPVPGTPFHLTYNSDRQAGALAGRSLHIPLSGSQVPASLQSIKVAVSCEGQVSTQSFPAAPNLSYDYVSPSTDLYGRPVQGKVPVTVEIAYCYPLYYYTTDASVLPLLSRFPWEGNSAMHFLQINGSRVGGTFEIHQDWSGTLDTSQDFSVGGWDSTREKLGGWTLSIHHVYDPNARALYLGTGDTESVEGFSLAMPAIAGNGTAGDTGDGGPAISAEIAPSGIAVGADGSLYIADSGDHVVRKVSPNGIISTFAGNGQAGYSGDGGPATAAELSGPGAVSVGADGSVYIADGGAVRRVDPNGVISTIAGPCNCSLPPSVRTESCGPGDTGPATQACISPEAICVGPDGDLYVSDQTYGSIRKVGADGLITTVAGGGGTGPVDGMPARQSVLWADGLTFDPNGKLYIPMTWTSDNPGYSHIFTVDSQGFLRNFAGNGQLASSGDGGPATQASLVPGPLATGTDGSIYVVDEAAKSIRRIFPDGTIQTVAGGGAVPADSLGGTATSYSFMFPNGLAVAPDGTVFVSDGGYNRVFAIRPTMASFFGNQFHYIPSQDGRQLFVFDTYGRHLKTLDALTGGVLYSFGYDAAGYLVTVTDGSGRVTTIQRDGSENATAIVSPDGITTHLSLDAEDHLTTYTLPGGESWALSYTPDGLLTGLMDPKGQAHSFAYDSIGRLTLDQDPAGGSSTLSRTDTTTGFSVALTTAEGRTSTYGLTYLPTGDEERTVTPAGCTCTASDEVIHTNGTSVTTSQDGTVTSVTEGPDPRFGMAASIPNKASITTPSGLTLAFSDSRATTLSDPNSVLSLQSQTDTVTVNGQTTTSAFNAGTGTETTTSPAGRTAVTTLDSLGRVTQQQAGSLTPVAYGYDANGHLTSVTQGSRSASLAYNAQGFLSGITDPLGRTVQFGYDADGHVTSQTLPDGQVIGFTYDANGNVTSVTPPGRPAHAFTYTPVDLQASYTPPDLGTGTTATTYAYNKDRQLTAITRPDGQSIAIGYDTQGRASTVTTPTGTTTLGYDATKGQLTSIQAPSGENEALTWDGFLPTGETWSGPVSGSLSRTFDNNFRVTGLSVDGQSPTAYAYDADGLLTGAGGLTLTRDPQTGLLTGSTLGGVTDSRTYTSYGELATDSAAYPAGLSFQDQYTRDAAGRIIQKVETINGTATTYGYSYDPDGRLTDVTVNGSAYSHYGYDSNGNRTSYTGPDGTAISGTYDNQDRMLTYGSFSYTYTANGELASKTDSTNGQVTQYTYDVLGNLRAVALPDGTDIQYLIDGRNRRIGKEVNGTLTQAWLYDGQLRPVAELDGSGNVVSTFIYATHVNVPDAMIKGGVTYRIITDHLGSPRFIIDQATGNIAERLDYDEFGNVLTDTNPGFQPFGFAGGLYDSQTGLVRFGARDYDALTGRWTCKDPLGYASRTVSLYSFCHDDPADYHDITGAEPISGALMGAFWGAYGAYMHGGDLGDVLLGAGVGAGTGALLGLLDPSSVLAAAALAAMAAGAGNAAAQGWDKLKDPCKKFSLGEMGGTMLGGFAGGAMGAAYVGATGLEGAAAQVAGDTVGGAVGLGIESAFTPFGE